MNHPIDRVLIAQARKYLHSVCKIFLSSFGLVDHQEVFGIVAIAHGIEKIVLAHLLLPQAYCLLEVAKKVTGPFACIDLSYLLINCGQKVVAFIAVHLYEHLLL